MSPLQPPTVTGLQPASGPPGTLVTIYGSGFTGAYSVQFGYAAVGPIVGADNLITVSAPPGEGTVSVSVTTPGGTSFGTAQFTYTG
jgi:hypothetical protein